MNKTIYLIKYCRDTTRKILYLLLLLLFFTHYFVIRIVLISKIQLVSMEGKKNVRKFRMFSIFE